MNTSLFNDLTGQAPDMSASWSSGFMATGSETKDLSMVMDLPVQVQVELGRAKLTFRALAQIEDGTVVELDTEAGKPVDMLVNGCLVARGEIVILNDRYGLRVTDIISPSERYTRKRN